MDKKKKELNLDLANARIIELERELQSIKSPFHDMAEKNKRDVAFVYREAHIRHIIDASPVPFALNDEEQNITYLNSAFVRTFGYQLSDIPTLSQWWVKAYPDKKYRDWVSTVWLAHLEKSKQTGLPFESFEIKICCKDGSQKTVMAGAVALTDEYKGEHLVTLFDISSLKKAIEAVQESEARYRMIVETAQEGIWTIDKNNDTSFVNPIMEKMLGYDVGEMLGRSMFDFMDDEGREIASNNVERRKKGIAEQHDFKFMRKDGVPVWVELNTNPLLDSDGEYIGALAMVTDITERRQSERALLKTQQLLLKTETLAQIGSWEWDLATDKVYWSPEMYRIYQYDSGDFPEISLSMSELRHSAEDMTKMRALIKHTMKTGVSSSIEYRIIFPDDSIKNIWGESDAIKNGDGKITHVVGFVRDITQAKQQEEQLRRSQKMDALGKLTGGIAHDYNNLLGIILGYSHLVYDALDGRPELEKHIKAIIHASERGSNLSRKLMAFSQNVQPEAKTVDVNEILIAEKDVLQTTLTPRIDLVLDLVDDVWPIYVNSSELEDALLNLSINAMHAMDDGGQLIISTSNQYLSQQEAEKYKLSSGDYMVLSVTDSGCGIASKELNCIFDPFYTTKGEAGMGLGLSMVYGFVKRSDGEIVVSSTVGLGSQFSLYFPRDTKISTDKTEAIDTPPTLDGCETILVVDDEPDLLAISKDVLSGKGYKVLTASNGNDALKLFNAHPIDMLLSDVIMTGMDGYQLAAEVRQLNPNIKVLLVSGYTENKHIKNSDAEVKEVLLQKPFSPQVLLKHVREVLDETPENLSDKLPGQLPEQATEKKPDSKPMIMVMDDEENIQALFEINLSKLGYDVICVNDGMEAVSKYQQSLESKHTIDVVILDLTIPNGFGGQETAKRILALDPQAKLIVSSGDSGGEIMTNFHKYRFKAALEKNFDRKQMQKVLEAILAEAV